MITITERNKEDENGSNRYGISIKRGDKWLGGFRAQPLWECPEDATLERDLGYAYDAIKFFKIGYEAGQKGEMEPQKCIAWMWSIHLIATRQRQLKLQR